MALGLWGDVFPEDGYLWTYRVGEDGVPALTASNAGSTSRQKSRRPRTAGGQTDRITRLRISPHANPPRGRGAFLASARRVRRESTLYVAVTQLESFAQTDSGAPAIEQM